MRVGQVSKSRDLFNMSTEEVARITTENAEQVFEI
jgi:hypothetical protein